MKVGHIKQVVVEEHNISSIQKHGYLFEKNHFLGLLNIYNLAQLEMKGWLYFVLRSALDTCVIMFYP